MSDFEVKFEILVKSPLLFHYLLKKIKLYGKAYKKKNNKNMTRKSGQLTRDHFLRMKGVKMNNEYAIEKMRTYYPWLATNMVSYRNDPFHSYELIVTLNDGGVYLYDHIENSVRKLPSSELTMTKNETAYEFGKRLAKIMWRKGLTQVELSKLTGINQPTISDYITGDTCPSFHNVDKIAKALGCSTDELRYI